MRSEKQRRRKHERADTPHSALRIPHSPVPVIGLVGGVGSGKSTVAGMMAGEGCRVVDADRIAHEVLQRPEVQEAVREAFGEAVFGPDGRVDRERLGQVVFSDAAARRRLERIVHPPTLDRVGRELAEARRTGPPAVVLDAPLILEKKLASGCDYVVYIQVPARVRHRRLREARGWSPSEVKRRDASQISLKVKQDRADYIVDNSASPEHTLEQVRQILARVTAR
ncbi:MAG: dephospho-CoA kinase [Planctomycetes bacterium]|nr:dephospho-CoA kinase [Planctomycetota bacterium]